MDKNLLVLLIVKTGIHYICTLKQQEFVMNMTAIAIVGIICWAIVEIVNSSKKKAKKVDTQAQEKMQQDLLAMQERIEVLEKIVTDEKYDLHRQFDELKKDKVA